MNHQRGTSKATAGEETIRKIWLAQQLGAVNSIRQIAAGSVNLGFIVNDETVIRFNIRDPDHEKFQNEAAALRILESAPVPIPTVICLDVSRSITDYDYLITSRLPGGNILDTRNHLQQDGIQQLAWQAGMCLASLHQFSFPVFGKVCALESHPFDTWFDYFADYASRYLKPATVHGLIDSDTSARLEDILISSEDDLSQVQRGALVHSDFHYENILELNGQISGIVDFEWCFSGDPASDFVASETREEVLPGSEVFFIRGYQSIQALDAASSRRIEIYRLFLDLETMVTAFRLNELQRIPQAKLRLIDRVEQLSK